MFRTARLRIDRTPSPIRPDKREGIDSIIRRDESDGQHALASETDMAFARERDVPGPDNYQSRRYLVLYALAAAGGSTSYAPFLTVILPQRIAEIAGPSAVEMLSYVAFFGAIAASISNIAFGWLSDLTGNRTGWIVTGVLLSSGTLLAMQYAATFPQLLALICIWQVALNMMLNPLSAWAGDCVPDHQKGILGGLLSLAPGAGALAGALVTIPGLASANERLAIIAGLVCAMVLPLVWFARPRPMPHLLARQGEPRDRALPPPLDRPAHAAMPVWRMWLARLTMQIAEAALFAFLFLWLRQVDRGIADNDVAAIFAAVLMGSVPLAIFAGRWSDRSGHPMPPLIIAAGCCAAGLVTMAAAPNVAVAIAGYGIFGVAAAVFLSLHTSQTLRVLPEPRHRGRDLGIFNLTNTIPSLIMPALSLTLIPRLGFDALFLALAALVLPSALLLATGRLR